MNLQDLSGMSISQLERLSTADLKEAYSYQRRILKSRFRTFEKRGLKNAIPKKWRSGVPTVRQIGDRDALIRAVGGAMAYMAGTTSTAKGYETAENELRSLAEDRLGITLTPKQFADYKAFMDQMSSVMKETWKHVSGEAEEMYLQSRRLGISLDQFQKNFSYWAENIHRLREVEPRAGRKTPSAYIKELRLPSITAWKKENRRR